MKKYGIKEKEFGVCKVSFIRDTMRKAVSIADIVIVSGSLSTMEILFSGKKVINYITLGKLSFVCLPERFSDKIPLVYDGEGIIQEVKKCKAKRISMMI